MGIISNFLSAAVDLDVTTPITALDRAAYRQLKALQAEGDPDLPAALTAANEVQSIAVYSGTVSGGTFTLTATLESGETFTTAAIAYDANAATIETAIDTAASPRNEVQSIAVYSGTVSGGTFTLTITFDNKETFTTAAIAYNANAATIETAIDVAATAAGITDWVNGDISVSGGDLTSAPVVLTFDGTSVAANNHSLTTIDGTLLTGGGSAGAVSTTTQGFVGVSGWTNGDITVAGGDLTSAPVTLTFDGTSVASKNHSLTTIDGTSLTGGGSAGAITTTTAGRGNRNGYAILSAFGGYSGTVPEQGVTPSSITISKGRLSPETIKAVASEIASAEGSQAIYTALVSAANL